MKKGITAASAVIVVIVMIILLGTVSILSYNSLENGKKLVFAIEIAQIQEEVTKYYKDSVDSTYPTTEGAYTINLSQVTEESVTQFDEETKTQSNEVTLYEIDLTAIGITDTTYGNKKTQKDVYVVSKDTGTVYYLEGVKTGTKTYYTITQDLIDIKARNEKEELTLEKPIIASDGISERTLTDGTKEKYIANIEVVGDEIQIFKYEIGMIPEESAKSYFKNNGTTVDGDRIKLKEEVTVTLYAENSQGDYAIKYAGYPCIPANFIASDISTEDEVNEGLVIYQGIDKVSEDTDASTTRNQFVWVPVPDIRDFVTRDGVYSGAKQTLIETKTAREPYSSNTVEVAEYAEMKASVEKYGGFYVGRYEAGTTNQRVSTGNGTSFKTDGVTPDVLIQKNKYPYNYVAYGTSNTNVTNNVTASNSNYDEGKGAVALSRSLFPAETNSEVVSTLIYGVQWDAIMNFMSDVENSVYPEKKYIDYSEGMAWSYSNSSKNSERRTGYDLLNTEGIAMNSVKNIFDMSGNMSEWTMELYQSWARIMRGWHYNNSNVNASYRGHSTVNHAYAYYGFRIALYIK